MEACYGYEYIHSELSKHFEVKLAHPTKVRAIAEARIKNDRIDAKVLADLLRSNLLPTAYMPSKEILELRKLCRERKRYVEERSKLKNAVRAELLRHGIKPKLSIWTKEGMRWLESLEIPSIIRAVRLIKEISKAIDEINERIDELADKFEEIEILCTIPGVGKYSACLIFAEIASIDRFASAEKLASYAGLVPSVKKSGNTVRYGPITKEGSKYLRWILVECVLIHVSRYETKLTQFYRRIAKRRGVAKAIIATARKLCSIIYSMLKKKEKFREWG